MRWRHYCQRWPTAAAACHRRPEAAGLLLLLAALLAAGLLDLAAAQPFQAPASYLAPNPLPTSIWPVATPASLAYINYIGITSQDYTLWSRTGTTACSQSTACCQAMLVSGETSNPLANPWNVAPYTPIGYYGTGTASQIVTGFDCGSPKMVADSPTFTLNSWYCRNQPVVSQFYYDFHNFWVNPIGTVTCGGVTYSTSNPAPMYWEVGVVNQNTGDEILLMPTAESRNPPKNSSNAYYPGTARGWQAYAGDSPFDPVPGVPYTFRLKVWAYNTPGCVFDKDGMWFTRFFYGCVRPMSPGHGGPYSFTTLVKSITLTASATSARTMDDPLDYRWVLNCPGKAEYDVTTTNGNTSYVMRVGGPQRPITLDGIAKTCNLTMIAYSVGNCPSAQAKTTISVPAINITVDADTGGPYKAVAPPGAQNTTVLVNGSLTYCPYGPCTYNWTMSCPGKPDKYYDGATLEVTGGDNPEADLDTSGSYSPITCTLTLLVVDQEGSNSTDVSTISISGPPPPVSNAGGPYTGSITYPGEIITLPVTANATQCTNPDCTYNWIMTCPGGTSTNFTGVDPTITAGADNTASIDVSAATTNTVCNLTVEVTDAGSRSSSATTRITISPPPPPVAATGGPYSGDVPPSSGTLTVTMNGTSSLCYAPTCVYDWTISCPGMAPVRVSGDSVDVTAASDPTATMDTTGWVSKKICPVTLTVSDARGLNSTRTTTLTLTPPPPPEAYPGGPYVGTVPPSGMVTVPISGASVNCTDTPCTYEWLLQCPGMTPQTLTVLNPDITAGPDATMTIDTTGLAVLNIRCSLDLTAVDESNRTSTARTTITIVPPPLPIARTNGPYNVSATSGTVLSVGVDGTNSSCRDPDCSYDWTLNCPGQPAQTFTGIVPDINCGPAGTSIPVGQTTSPISCTVSLLIIDRSKRNSTVTTAITVMPPPLPVADDGGPYAATVPPSGIATVQINGSMSSCGDPDCNYDWTLQCPGGAAPQTFNGLYPVFTAGPSSSETIDTTGLRTPTTCSLILDMTDLRGKTDSSTTTVTITPPPLPAARTTGPYAVSATTGSDTQVPVDGTNSTCGDPDCTYEWTLQCPGAAAQTFGGPQPYITAGSSSSNVDIGIRYTPFDCNLTLVVTDRSLRTSGINTRVTVTPPPRPVARDNGPYTATVPPSGIATWVLDGGNSSCYDQPCQYVWVVSCPGVPNKTFSEMAPVVTAGPSSFETIDTTGARAAINCNLNLTITDPRGHMDYSTTTLTINPPPLPVARTTGPYAVSATTAVNVPVPVDATNTTCGDPDCTYAWTLRCPGVPDQSFTGASPFITAGGAPGATIDITGKMSPIVCNGSLVVTDRSMRTSSLSTRITVTPPPVPVTRPGGPYSETVPPGGIATVPVDGGNSTCYDPGCTYAWKLSCPGKPVATLSGPTPAVIAGPGAGNTIDTTGSKVNISCTLNLTVTDVRGKAVTAKTSVTIMPPPLPVAKTNGPWNTSATTGANTPVPVDASNTTCGDPDCTYDWLLRCPGAADKTFTSVMPDVTAGGTGSASIDITGASGPIRCNMSLTVVDRSGRSSQTSARLTITPPPAPIPGSTGPYMMEVPNEGIAALTASAGNSTCFDPPCSFTWLLSCPNKTAVPLSGSAPALTAGPSPFETIDTTGARFNFTCTLNLTAVDVRGKATTTKTYVTVAPPAVPIARTTGPYNITANTAAPTVVPLDGTNTTCNDLPCTYSWLIQCPNKPDVTTSGVTPTDVTAGGPGATVDLTGVTSPIRCNVTLTVADRSQRISATSTRLTVTPPPLPVIRTGGPYRTSVPPGGIATIPVVASNSSCYDPVCTYLWTLDCPNVAPVTFNIPDPILTAGPSPAESIDTTLARSNVTCNLTLAITDATSRTVTSRTSVTVAPPPLPKASTSGPYSVYGDAFGLTVIPVDGTNSTCGDPECTYSWLLQCPNSPTLKEFSGPQPYVTAGGRGNSIEMLRIDNGTITCNMTLTVIDRSARSSAINTRITVSEPPPPPPPTARTTGPYRQAVPPGGIATVSVDGTNSSCAEDPCTYTWTLLCPNATAKTFDGVTASITTGPSPSEGIDTTGIRSNFSCSLNLTVVDERGRPSVASTTVTIAPPPLPAARTTGPYTVTASSTGLTSIPVSSINSTCGDPECTHSWLLQCPGLADQTFTGPTPEVTAGGAGASIPIAGANITSVVCNMTLMVVDRSSRVSSSNTRITVMPPGPPVPPNFGSGGVITPVPPGGTGVVPLGSANTTCSDAPCTYAWKLDCPGAGPKTSNVPDPAFTAGPSPSETIDTTAVVGNLTCDATVTMTDALGRSATGSGRVIVITPPLPVPRTNGPFNASVVAGTNVPIVMDASNSTCNDPECTYTWWVLCPGADAKSLTGVTPDVTIGDSSATIDASGMSSVTRCNVTLWITDRSMRNASTTTRLTISPPGAPIPPDFGAGGAGTVVVPPGGQGSLSIDPKTTCSDPPCNFEWVVMCPKAAPKTYTDPVLLVTAGPSAADTVVDTTGIRGNFSCNFTVAITDKRNRTASARSFFSVVTPPLAKPSTGGPYNVTADPTGAVTPVPIDASNTTCGDPECVYVWLLRCPGKPDANFTGLAPAITVGSSSTASIDTTGVTTSFKCNLTLAATDRSNRTATSSTTLAVTIQGSTGGDPVTGGPYAVTVPPGAMGSVKLNGTGSPCVVSPCSYLWILSCPENRGSKTFTEVSPEITAGPSPSEDIDTTGLTQTITCNLTLRVTDAPRAAVAAAAVRESTTYITVTPPPLPRPLSGGPYSVTGSGTSMVTIPVDGTGSDCNDPACTYAWTLECPQKPAIQLTGEKPIVTAGNSPDATIDTTGAKGLVNCNLTMVLTDRSKRTGAVSTTVSVTPVAPPPPGEVDAGNNFVFSADASACASGPCTYEWTCTETSVPTARGRRNLLQGTETWTRPGAELQITSGYGSSYDVDMTMQKDSRQVSCVCKTTDSQGRVTTGLPQVKVVRPLAPDCAKALAAPKGIKASTKVCSGTTGLYQTISLTPFQDPQGFTVSLNVTGISSNQLVPSCSSCGRRRNGAQPQQGCACAPAGKPISGGSAACVLPIVAKNRRRDGRIYRVQFAATADTGLQCTGSVSVCVGGSKAARNRRQNVRQRAGYVDGYGAEVDPNCTGTRCRPNPSGPLVCRDDGASYDATSTSCQTQS